MKDEEFAKSLSSTTANLDRISGGLSRGEGTAGKLLKDDALYKRLDAVTGRLDTLLTRLNDGQGTAGQLLQDKRLYENMNGVVTDMRSLLGGNQEGSQEVPEREGQYFLSERRRSRSCQTIAERAE